MVKIEINKADSMKALEDFTIEVHVEGHSSPIIHQLSKAVYNILKELKMEEEIDTRLELFHGAMLFHQLFDKE